MNRDPLTLMGCASSLAFVLLSGGAAKALVPPTFTGDSGAAVGIQAAPSSSAQDTVLPVPQATDARIKELAQATFGCTCINCQNSVRQMIQQGILSL